MNILIKIDYFLQRLQNFQNDDKQFRNKVGTDPKIIHKIYY